MFILVAIIRRAFASLGMIMVRTQGKSRLHVVEYDRCVRFPSLEQKRAIKFISSAFRMPSSGPRIIKAVARASASRAVGARR